MNKSKNYFFRLCIGLFMAMITMCIISCSNRTELDDSETAQENPACIFGCRTGDMFTCFGVQLPVMNVSTSRLSKTPIGILLDINRFKDYKIIVDSLMQFQNIREDSVESKILEEYRILPSFTVSSDTVEYHIFGMQHKGLLHRDRYMYLEVRSIPAKNLSRIEEKLYRDLKELEENVETMSPGP